MVAKITVPGSIKRALNYNENKVKEGVAICLYAHAFLKDAQQLRFQEKLARFENLIQLNCRAKTNTLHVSLNFHPDETMSAEKMIRLAREYMERLGFGNQPYLVYEHRDAGHPHLHIVSTNIEPDGRRISLHNIGKERSEKAREALEQTHGLRKAEGKIAIGSSHLQPASVQRAVYGKGPTKRAITNVLDAILSTYKYGSLPELNAILQTYRVRADRGSKEGQTYRNGGLLYRLLDDTGKPLGVPIKASSIYSQPTLRFLETQFDQNKKEKEAFKPALRTRLDWVLQRTFVGLQAFEEALKKEKVSLVTRQNESGYIYGLTYIDHNTRCVVNGSEIGKTYSAKAVLEKCGISPSLSASTRSIERERRQEKEPLADQKFEHHQNHPSITDILFDPHQALPMIPSELRQKKKRKQKRKK